jgi:hypothetical protein
LEYIKELRSKFENIDDETRGKLDSLITEIEQVEETFRE